MTTRGYRQPVLREVAYSTDAGAEAAVASSSAEISIVELDGYAPALSSA